MINRRKYMREYMREYMRKWRDEDRKSLTALYKKSYRKRKQQILTYQASHVEEIGKYLKKYRDNNPEKVKAHNILNKAVATGLVKKCPCRECGAKTKVHGHHPDYTKPLEVIWLCAPHHKAEHSKINMGIQAL